MIFLRAFGFGVPEAGVSDVVLMHQCLLRVEALNLFAKTLASSACTPVMNRVRESEAQCQAITGVLQVSNAIPFNTEDLVNFFSDSV